MSKTIVLQLPDALVQRAELTAELTGRPLEIVLAEWLERSVETVYHIYTPLGNEHLAEALMKYLEVEQSHDNGIPEK